MRVCVCVSVCIKTIILTENEKQKKFSFKMKTTRINGKKRTIENATIIIIKKNHRITIKMIIILFIYTK